MQGRKRLLFRENQNAAQNPSWMWTFIFNVNVAIKKGSFI